MKLPSFVLGLAGASALTGSLFAAEAIKHGNGDTNAGREEEAKSAMKSFKNDPGLKATLFASEPLMANAVAFTLDAKGRWYIAESYRQEKGVEDNRGHADWLSTDIASQTTADRLAMMRKFYPDEQKFKEKFATFEERIVRIEDSDGDGVADKSTVYADGFRDPLDGTGAGILARGNEVWWTCIPNLWRFVDADDDGKAEGKEKLLSGFGIKFALRGHDMHGLRFGPDGKLYFSIGDRAINVVSKEGKEFAETDTGSILRCNPDGTGFEIFATGVRNPQELAFDELGNLFTGDNNSDLGDKARFVNLVEGGDCGWRMAYQYISDRGPWNREMLWDEKEGLKAKYIIPPIANVANGPSGLTYNPGTALGEKYQGRFFLSDFRGGASASVVHQIALEPSGAWFKLRERRDFLQGVLTTDCEFGNDGSLYVLDWVSSWSGVGKARIYKMTDPTANTALQAETQTLIAEGMTQRAEPDLVKLLGHADMRVRQAAQFALADRGAVSLLATVAGDIKAAPLARIHAIWGIGQLQEKKSGSAAPLVALLNDADGEIRAQSARVLGDRKFAGEGAAEKLLPLLRDSAPRARFFAALALGKLAHKPAVAPLFQMLAENNDRDPILRHGAVMGLTGCADAQQLAAKSGDGSSAVRVGALLALRRQKSAAIAAFLNDGDESVVLEGARAIHDVPIHEAMPALAALSTRKGLKNARILERAINAHYRLGKAENAHALVAFAAEASAPEESRKDALDALTNWATPAAQDRLLNLWRPLPDRPAVDAVAAVDAMIPVLLKESPTGVREMTAKLVAKLSVASAGEPLAQLVANSKAGTAARVAALQALVSLKDSRLVEAAKAAFASNNAKLRSEGLQTLAKHDPTAAVSFIAETVRTGSVIERQGALSALSGIQRPEAHALLGEHLTSMIAGQTAPEIQLDILNAAQKSAEPSIKEKLEKYKASFPAGDELAPYRVSLAGGDVENGRKLFREKAEVQCLRCHRCEMGDSVVGPDLTHIGANRDRKYILESIIFPNRTISQGFGIVSLTLKDGSIVAGRLISEDPAGLKIETLDAQGKPVTAVIPVANVKERMNAPSPMPESTRDNLSKSELRDIVEYLATRK
ncbi:MAG: PVC-type heme-binding CxxCH protein [Verrucomicrobiota bacterium]